jgi:hypothetical protein
MLREAGVGLEDGRELLVVEGVGSELDSEGDTDRSAETSLLSAGISLVKSDGATEGGCDGGGLLLLVKSVVGRNEGVSEGAPEDSEGDELGGNTSELGGLEGPVGIIERTLDGTSDGPSVDVAVVVDGMGLGDGDVVGATSVQ